MSESTTPDGGLGPPCSGDKDGCAREAALEQLVAQSAAAPALAAAAANKNPAMSRSVPTEKIASTPTTNVENAQIENASRLRRRLGTKDAAMPTIPIEKKPNAQGIDCSI